MHIIYKVRACGYSYTLVIHNNMHCGLIFSEINVNKCLLCKLGSCYIFQLYSSRALPGDLTITVGCLIDLGPACIEGKKIPLAGSIRDAHVIPNGIYSHIYYNNY